MTTATDSSNIVPPVDMPLGSPSAPQEANPAALSIEQLAKAMGMSAETIRRHVADGAPAGANGRINLIHYAAWLNMRLLPAMEGNTDGA